MLSRTALVVLPMVVDREFSLRGTQNSAGDPVADYMIYRYLRQPRWNGLSRAP